MNNPSIQSVANAFSVLEYVLEMSIIAEGTGLAEIAEKFGMRKTTARNMMQTLEYCGYIVRSARGIYHAGEKCGMLSKAGVFAGKLREWSRECLRSAAAETGESFLLTILFNGRRLVAGSASGNEIISINAENVEREQTWNYLRVTTRVLLAFCTDSELKKFLEQNPPNPDYWPEAFARPDGLASELKKIRAQGVCRNHSASRDHFFAEARPVFDRSGRFLGAVGGYIPLYRADDAKQKTIGNALTHITETIRQKEFFS